MDIKEATRKRLEELGISIEGLISLMEDFKAEDKPIRSPFDEKIPEKLLEMKVKNILNRLGTPAHMKGYQYAADAIVLVVRNKDLINVVTREIYPKVAEKNNTTPSRVERNIRNLLEVSWGTREEQREIFGTAVRTAKRKPTNSEFIATIADYIRMGGE